jgi:hypothetical protein
MGVVEGGGNLARGRAAKLRDPVRRYYSVSRGFMAWRHLPLPMVNVQLKLLKVSLYHA